jgi:ubiquinone/menaquinone biosynthesis C-methylase UbiE
LESERSIIKNKIQKEYDLKSGSYDELYSEEQISKYRSVRKWFELNSQTKILDIGCGTGLFIEKIEEKVELIIGIDLSIRMLQKAKLKLCNKFNTHLINSDMEFLPLKKYSFDLIFIFTVFQNSSEIFRTIEELRPLLAPRSKIIISIFKKNMTLNDIKEAISRINKNEYSIKISNTKDFIIELKMFN